MDSLPEQSLEKEKNELHNSASQPHPQMGAIFEMLKKHISEQVSGALGGGIGPEQISFLDTPSLKMGDLALPWFLLAKDLKKDPKKLAGEIAGKIIETKWIDRVQAVGPYLNIFFNRNNVAVEVLRAVAYEGENFGRSDALEGRRMMMEYVSPNTNKPLHLGHVRNALLGWSAAKLLASQGATVIKTDVINDRGIHIMKSLLAYQQWGKGETPQSSGEKGDHFVGRYYVFFEQKFQEEKRVWLEEKKINLAEMNEKEREETEQQFLKESRRMAETRELLKRWEANDPEVRSLWQRMNEWVYEGFKRTYELLGVDFDKHYYESEIYEKGREIILDAVERGVFSRAENGAVIAPLSRVDPSLTDKTLLRADGTGLYITQDIYLAMLKFREYDLTDSLYSIGSEQDYYMRQLFAILKMLGFPWANRLIHITYGMVYLPEGKMKSREGTVVDADTLIHELKELARASCGDRYPELPVEERELRAHVIALAALKFHILMVGRKNDIHFNPKESLAFEGKTGPYLLYAYARIASIFSKEEKNKARAFPLRDKEIKLENITITGDTDWQIIRELLEFPGVLDAAAKAYDPSILCEYLFRLSQTFSAFYHELPILKAKEPYRSTRLAIAGACQLTLKNGLKILGIGTLEEM